MITKIQKRNMNLYLSKWPSLLKLHVLGKLLQNAMFFIRIDCSVNKKLSLIPNDFWMQASHIHESSKVFDADKVHAVWRERSCMTNVDLNMLRGDNCMLLAHRP